MAVSYTKTHYLLTFRDKTYTFNTLGTYYDYLESMNQRKVKNFPKLDKVQVMNIFLMEFEGRKLDELEMEDALMRAESY